MRNLFFGMIAAVFLLGNMSVIFADDSVNAEEVARPTCEEFAVTVVSTITLVAKAKTVEEVFGILKSAGMSFWIVFMDDYDELSNYKNFYGGDLAFAKQDLYAHAGNTLYDYCVRPIE